jgi:pyruvate ferredoxin oxidoreductase beta subunit
VATATVADLRDLEYKATRAMDFHGARYLHILVPCPLGWGSPPAETIRVARLAAESGLFPVFEAESGEVVAASPIRRQVPVQDYLRLQARYRHLFHPQERTEVIARIQASADRNIARFGLLDNRTLTADHPERDLVIPDPHSDSQRPR